jgi:hypothetical protein
MRIVKSVTKCKDKWVRILEPLESQGGDETYSHPDTGTHNITMVMRDINSKNIEPHWVKFLLDDTWKRVAREGDINPERLALVTDEECKASPLILFKTGPSEAVCADGMHRLRYMIDHKWNEAVGAMLTLKQVEHCRILYEEAPSVVGPWTTINTQLVIDSMLGSFPMYKDGKRIFYPDVKPKARSDNG